MTSDNFAIRHEIFVLDAHLKNALDPKRYEQWTRDFIDHMLQTLGMEPLGKLEIYPAVDLRAPGWSFIQPITTSHISGHYFEKPGRNPHMRMDLYSCEAVDRNAVIATAHEHMELADWRGTFIQREIEQEGHRSTLDLRGFGKEVLSEVALGEVSPAAASEAVTTKHVEQAMQESIAQ